MWPFKGPEVTVEGVDRGSALREDAKGSVDVGHSLAQWSRTGKPHPDYIDQVGDLYRRPGVFTRVNNLVLQVVGTGYYTTVDGNYPEGTGPKVAVDEMAARVGLDQRLNQITGNMLVYGFAPVELITSPGKGITRLKLLPPPTVRYQPDPNGKGDVIGYLQGKTTFKPGELAWFNWSLVSSDPYGVSLLAPIMELQDIEEDAVEDMSKILRKYWKLMIIWKTDSRGTATALKAALEKLEPDEDPIISEGAGGRVEHEVLQMDPRIRFWDFIMWLDDMKSDELQSPSLSKFRNATEASATKMEDIIDRWGQGVQRYLKRTVEQEFFRPHVEALGYEEVPRMNFGMPRSGVEEISVADIAALSNVATGPVLTPGMAKALLRKMGIPVEEAEAT